MRLLQRTAIERKIHMKSTRSTKPGAGIQRSLALASLTLLAGCSSTPPVTEAPIGDPATDPAPKPATEAPSIDTSVISAEFPFEKKFVDVNGQQIAYVDTGNGPVVLFLHGNPTSSYLWRNIIPHVAPNHRAIALDLIGMGDSAKPDIDYSFSEHATYVDGFIEALNLKDITLVVHDWGSGLGMRYARLHEDNVRALAFMEALIPPGTPIPSYEAMGPFGEVFRNMRTKGVGEKMVLEQNFFIEVLVGKLIVRKLSEKEMAEYRRPYATPKSRRPTLKWPREVPIAGEPENTTKELVANGKWLTSSELPKLFLYAQPGAINPAPVVEFVKTNVKNVKAVDVGEGLHFIQEDRPHEIGQALSEWLGSL